MEIIFLGTSAMVPTKERNVSGIFLDYRGEGILVDCGEGTQRQMNIAGINRLKVKKILITHWHGDHVSGLIGLIQTIGNNENPPTLTIFGPDGTKESLSHMMKTCIFTNKVNIIVKEIHAKDAKKITTIFDCKDYYIEAINLAHGVPTLAYSFMEKDKRKVNMETAKKLGLAEGPLIGKLQKGYGIESKGKKVMPDDVSKLVKGRKVTFVIDTTACEEAAIISKNSDILVMEASYAHDLEDKARMHMHLTARDAAQIAHHAGAKRLILTHFSQRYKTVEEILEDAGTVFPKAECAFDFMKIKL